MLNEVVIGKAQDLYETIVANPSSWSVYETPGQYMQSLFTGRSYTYTGMGVTPAIEGLNKMTTDEQLSSIKKDPNLYMSTQEDLEATTQILENMLQNTPPSMENISKRQDILNLQSHLWTQSNYGGLDQTEIKD